MHVNARFTCKSMYFFKHVFVQAFYPGGKCKCMYFFKHEFIQAYYLWGKCDLAADKEDCSRLWYVNAWAMKWSQKEWSWITKPALLFWWSITRCYITRNLHLTMPVTCITYLLHVTACNYMFITCYYMIM